MLRKIVLHGRLGKRFGRSFKLDVESPAEALRALILQLRGFREHLREGNYRIVRGQMSRGHDLDLDCCKLGLGSAGQLHIVPVVAGSASGIGKVLAGVALVALAFAMPYFAPGIAAFGVAGLTVAGVTASIGFSLALGGVAAMLAPSPTLAGGSATDPKASFLFGGQDNVTTQGGPVPLVYGLFRTGSVVISAGIDTEELSSSSGGGTTNPFDVLFAAGFNPFKGH
jgi:predicted phage tail protein